MLGEVTPKTRRCSGLSGHLLQNNHKLRRRFVYEWGNNSVLQINHIFRMTVRNSLAIPSMISLMTWQGSFMFTGSCRRRILNFDLRSAPRFTTLMIVAENSYGECGERQPIKNEENTHFATADRYVLGGRASLDPSMRSPEASSLFRRSE